ncbi:hypothetical protein D3C72_2507060 [compost metagenome]
MATEKVRKRSAVGAAFFLVHVNGVEHLVLLANRAYLKPTCLKILHGDAAIHEALIWATQ